MTIEPLDIAGAWSITPKQFSDDRGLFLEVFKEGPFATATGSALHVAQVNTSVSRRGTVRGIHYADVPPGQAKYVFCPSGAVLDVIVDIRVGSPTFGRWQSVRLDDVDRRAVFLSEGLGHAFVSLIDGSVVTYLCSTVYNPTAEHGVNPLDTQLAIDWGIPPEELLLSPKDAAEVTLQQAGERGLLPHFLADEG